MRTLLVGTLAMATLVVSCDVFGQNSTTEDAPTVTHLLDCLRSARSTWQDFRADYEIISEYKPSDDVEWTPNYIQIGRFERVADTWQYVYSAITVPTRFPDSTHAVRRNIRTLDDGSQIQIDRHYEVSLGEAQEALTLRKFSPRYFHTLLPYRGKQSEGVSVKKKSNNFMRLDEETELFEQLASNTDVKASSLDGLPTWQVSFNRDGKRHVFEFSYDDECTPMRYTRSGPASNYQPFRKPVRRSIVESDIPIHRPGRTASEWRHLVTYEHTDGTSIQVRTTKRLVNIKGPINRISPLWEPPSNGSRVVLMDQQQIAAEWRDGEIVKVVDGEAVERLAQVEFVRPTRLRSLLLRGMQASIVFAVVSLLGWMTWKHLARMGISSTRSFILGCALVIGQTSPVTAEPLGMTLIVKCINDH